MGSTSQRLDLGEGVTLRVEQSGDEDHPLVVLLHGFTGDASTMAGLARALAPTHRVLVPDLMGHGASSAPSLEAHSIDAMVEQLTAVLDRLGGPGPVDVVGYSMGGRVALTLACRHPARVRTLTLVGASAGLAGDAERSARVAADEELARFIEIEGVEAFVDRWMANPLFATQARLGEEALAGFRAQRLRNDPVGLARSLRAAGTGRMRPLHDDLRDCVVPTTLVAGADDEKFVAIAEDLAGRLPAAEVVRITDAGHAAHLEQQSAVAAAIRSRLARPAVEVRSTLLRLVAPLRTSFGSTAGREVALVRVAGAAEEGWGEVAPLPGWSPVGIGECLETLEQRDLQHEVRGLARLAGGGLDWWSQAGGVLAMIDHAPEVRAGVVGALLDLEARGRGLVLADLLAARFGARSSTVATEVPVHALLSAEDPRALAAEARRLTGTGVSAFKIKVGALAPDRDLERVAAVRAGAPDALLRLDANGAWDEPTALAVLEGVAELDVALCEEPVAGVEAIARLGARSPVAVAVDESARTLDDLRRVWPCAPSIAAVVVKPQALGGADRALAAVAEARRHGVEVIVTTMIDSAIGVAHAAHVAAAAALPGPHGLDTSRVLAEDVADPLPVEAGVLRLRRHRPGLGVGAVAPPTG